LLDRTLLALQELACLFVSVVFPSLQSAQGLSTNEFHARENMLMGALVEGEHRGCSVTSWENVPF
jgi:hypothetical protein